LQREEERGRGGKIREGGKGLVFPILSSRRVRGEKGGEGLLGGRGNLPFLKGERGRERSGEGGGIFLYFFNLCIFKKIEKGGLRYGKKKGEKGKIGVLLSLLSHPSERRGGEGGRKRGTSAPSFSFFLYYSSPYPERGKGEGGRGEIKEAVAEEEEREGNPERKGKRAKWPFLNLLFSFSSKQGKGRKKKKSHMNL